jgi:hypothetical protein
MVVPVKFFEQIAIIIPPEAYFPYAVRSFPASQYTLERTAEINALLRSYEGTA